MEGINAREYIVQQTRLLKGLDSDVIRILTKYDCYCCGGAITSVFTGREINDYDIYSVNKDNPSKIVEELKEIDFELKVISHNAYSLVRKSKKDKNRKRLKIQIIKYENFCNENIEDTFNYFDFSCCMGAYSFSKKEFFLDKNFLVDNMEKRLRFNSGTEYPICSLYRTKKYQDKGYTLPGVEMIKIALAINNLNMKNYKDLKQQLMGIDTAFLKPLTDVLLNEEEEYEFDTFKDILSNFYSDYYEKIINKAFNDEEEESDDDIDDELCDIMSDI